jgi:hypothetical protein
MSVTIAGFGGLILPMLGVWLALDAHEARKCRRELGESRGWFAQEWTRVFCEWPAPSAIFGRWYVEWDRTGIPPAIWINREYGRFL